MQRTEQQKTDDTPVVSPLAKDKTYGERVYHGVVDWGINYWANLLASAGFTQYAEHATRPIKLWGMNEAASPRELQQKLANWLRDKDPLLKSLHTKIEASEGLAKATEVVAERSMARARSITLLMPGFLIVIPTVWLGAKIKPWLVEKLDARHYGAEAMDDPTLKARHQAIAAEARPTFLGATIGRLGTMLAAQIASQAVGSKNNFVNKIGDKVGNESLQKFGIDPFTKSVGEGIGGALPLSVRERYNSFTRRKGLDWSEEQRLSFGKTGPYSTATEDLGRFIAADTVYTMVTALTIHPVLKLLRYVPFMSYKPKVSANSATFDEYDNIKVPSNHYADSAPELLHEGNTVTTTPSDAASLARSDDGVDAPSTRVSKMRGHVAPQTSTPHAELASAR
ncbi:MAG: hypothetical protein K2X09_06315 [Rickettsiales bacterium]|nr:hypothetical protein [Rickettsiales bacterium]